jgi:peptidyl-dipeptidase A
MRKIAVSIMVVVLFGCSNKQKEVQNFIDSYNEQFVKLFYASSEAAWSTNTEIKEGDTLNAYNSKVADEALTAFTGSVKNIEQCRTFLESKENLTPLQVRQLEMILYYAGSDPQTVPELIKEKIKANIEQTEKLYGFTYKIDDKVVSTNEIDEILEKEINLNRRLLAWTASKEVGVGLKSGLVNLRRLRNETVQALNYPDFFSYQVSDYGLTTQEMIDLMSRLNNELRPLYRELHTYARYELAKKYGVTDVPDMIPAHWLPNRWGQEWGKIVSVKGLNIDSVLATKSPEWIVKEGENLYRSLGFPPLPSTFWEKSSLYPYPSDSIVKKNNHASAWHLDLNNDVRSLMSVESNGKWFETSNHELGHIYYFLTYTNPNVPPTLRGGANRAFHEAIGSMMGMAAMQKPYLVGRGLINEDAKTDSIQILLSEALNHVVFIPFAAGTMSEFEKAIYTDNLPESEWNKKWWDLVKKYQGITPPTDRNENYCDAATKTHINDDPGQYYDYALSSVILFQLHKHISDNILKQNPRSTNYYGNKEIGQFLKKIMESGASRNWREVLMEATGNDMNANSMLDYFEPLLIWLKEQNKGRKYTLPEDL